MSVGPQTYKPREPRRTVGDTVTFIPAAFVNYEDAAATLRLKGRVVYVNEVHRFYVAEAECWGYRLREAFLF